MRAEGVSPIAGVGDMGLGLTADGEMGSLLLDGRAIDVGGAARVEEEEVDTLAASEAKAGDEGGLGTGWGVERSSFNPAFFVTAAPVDLLSVPELLREVAVAVASAVVALLALLLLSPGLAGPGGILL